MGSPVVYGPFYRHLGHDRSPILSQSQMSVKIKQELSIWENVMDDVYRTEPLLWLRVTPHNGLRQCRRW